MEEGGKERRGLKSEKVETKTKKGAHLAPNRKIRPASIVVRRKSFDGVYLG